METDRDIARATSAKFIKEAAAATVVTDKGELRYTARCKFCCEQAKHFADEADQIDKVLRRPERDFGED
jgi:hypothetical protein